MGYIVDYDSMQKLLGAYTNAVGDWNAAISSVMQKVLVIEASTNIAGNRAYNMKQYLSMTYSCAKDSLVMLLELFRQNYLLYNEAYHQDIDTAGDAYIKSEELNGLRDRLKAKKSQFQQLGLNAENTVTRISDIVSLPSLDISEPDMEFDRLITLLDELDASINALESAHVSADFAEIDEMISRLDAYFTELIGQSKEFKTGFSSEGFFALASVPGLISAMHNAYDQLSAQESDVANAVINLEKRLEQEQQEMEKRKQQAEWAKIGLTAVVGLVSAAALVTAGPVGVVAIGAIGAISGAASAMIGAAADEYAENGWNMSDWDVNRITFHGCIGAVTGMISGFIAPDTGLCAKAGIKALSSALEGAVSTSYDQIAASGRITDAGQIAKDSLLKGSGAFVGNLVGGAVSDKMGDIVKQNSIIKDLSENVVGGVKHFGAVLQVEGASELVSGAAKRFSSTAVQETGSFFTSVAEGETVAEAYKEHNIVSKSIERATDIKNIVGDTASAVTSASTDDPLIASQKKLERRTDDYYLFGDSPDLSNKKDSWKDWNSEEYDRMMEKLAEMDARGDDARNYEIFGDSRSFATQRSSAVNQAWEQERRLVLQGRGTRDWTVSQQEELIRTGKVSGFDGSHMLDASNNPSVANDSNNIQFLTYEEHIYGAHGGNTRNQTTGWYDATTGKTTTINPRQIPHREETAFELSQKFDYTQLDLADQLGADFGYDREKK